MLLAAGGPLGKGHQVEELRFRQSLGGDVEEMAKTAGVELVPVLAIDFHFRHGGQLRRHT